MDRRILHVDIDAFLASVEQIRDPSLRGRPVVVGTGVVASRSYEARARGVHTAMSLAQAQRRCPDLVLCAGDARLAERYRQRTAEVLRRFTPVVEVCSLDDFYADMTGVPLPAGQSLASLCLEVRSQVRAATGLSIAQGIGSTRTVARLATTKAKPGGICEVGVGDESDFLAGFDVGDLPGVGPKTAAMLRQVGVTTVRGLRAVDRELLQQSFGARGDEIWRRCRALDTAPVVATPTIRSISRETSFDPTGDADSQQRPFLRGMLSYLLDRASSEMRRLGLAACAVRIKVHHVDGLRGAKARTLADPTDRTDALMCVAAELLDRLLTRRVLVRLVGVSLSSLCATPAAQRHLFGDDGHSSTRLFAAVDAVRRRHGFGSLVVGGATELLGRLPHGRHGFRLRTPSLTR